jgi:hypothetical protein
MFLEGYSLMGFSKNISPLKGDNYTEWKKKIDLFKDICYSADKAANNRMSHPFKDQMECIILCVLRDQSHIS